MHTLMYQNVQFENVDKDLEKIPIQIKNIFIIK